MGVGCRKVRFRPAKATLTALCSPRLGLMLWSVADFTDFPFWARMLFTSADIAIRIALLGIVPGNRRPAVAMAWLVIIFFFPLPGLLLLSLFRSLHLGGPR